MDDWQDHALSTRHMHNRNSRRGSGKGRKDSAFDVRKAFGEYAVKCAGWEKAVGGRADEGAHEPALELLRLTSDGQGVLGELVLPGLLNAAVVLAASRRTLAVVVAGLKGEGTGDEDDEEEEDDEEDEDEGEEEENPSRFTTFEKNSFRTPKFWLAWSGTLTASPASPPPSPSVSKKGLHLPSNSSDSPPSSPTLARTGSSFPPPKPKGAVAAATPAAGLGYVTFTGHECRKFKGTLSVAELGWRDVAVSGFKSVSRSESDRQVVWAGRDVETGWREGVGEVERGARVDGRRRVIFD